MKSFFQKLTSDTLPSFEEIIATLTSEFPLLSDLVNTEQSAIWHKEGNVFIHTEMVLNELMDILQKEGSHLTSEKRLILILSAVLHDVGKVFTSKKQGDTIICPHHEMKGASYLFFRLPQLPLSEYALEQILHLVAYHDQPKRLVKKNAGQKEYFKLARSVDVELLYFLEKADMRGRVCEDREGQEEIIELFKLHCIDAGVWQCDDPYKEWRDYISQELKEKNEEMSDFLLDLAIQDFEQGGIQSYYEAIPKFYRYLEGFPQLVVMCGPSGSGKSSWYKKHLQGFHCISLDDLREEIGSGKGDQSVNHLVIPEAMKRLRHHLGKKGNVVWDATNLMRDFRRPICQMGFNYEAHVTIAARQLSFKELYKNNKERKEFVPDEVIDQQLSRFELVEKSEAHRVITIR